MRAYYFWLGFFPIKTIGSKWYSQGSIQDRVQTKTSPFSARHIIWVNSKVVSQLSQLIFRSCLYLNTTRHNLFIELFHALKYFNFCLRLFNKLAYSFVAIELLDFSKNEKFQFYWSRDLSVFGLKIYILLM